MEVTPNILEFKGDFLKPNTEYLTLTNDSNGPLAFKVKTTAPKLYSVRPNANIIHPGESLKISINLQAYSQPLSKFYKCKDKFLIVALPCSKDADSSKVGEFWSDLEKANKSQLISKKLRVNYIIEDGGDNIEEEDTPAAEPVQGGVGKTTGAAVGGIAAGAAAGVAQATSHVNKDKAIDTGVSHDATIDSKEDLDSYNQINELSEKFDKTESEDIIKPAKTEEPFGFSLVLTVILMILAFIIGWLIF